MRNAAPKLTIATAPALEPVLAGDLATWIGVDATDPLLTPLAKGARDVCERHLGIALITQTWDQFFDLDYGAEPWWEGVREGPISEIQRLPKAFVLARWPVASVTTVNFYDELDQATLAAVASYYVDKQARQPAIVLKDGFSWPSLIYRVRDAVIVRFVAGFGANATDVPDTLKNGIKALAAFQYEHRGECDVEEAIDKSGAAGFWSPYSMRRT